MSATETAFVFAVVSEAESDQEVARGLAERVLVESIDWLEAASFASLCQWRGFDEGSSFLSWTKGTIERWMKDRHLVVHGRFGGKFDESLARKALLLFNDLERRPDAVFLVRDTDNVPERVPSLERARDHRWAFQVVLATPHAKRECWILNGFEPRDDSEVAALERARRRIGFDPCLEAHRLTAKGSSGKKNAKAILEHILGVQQRSARETACFQDTDLEVLRERGGKTLLAAYLQEVVDRVAPIVAVPSRRP